jgi:two-component system sensor histidine kinase VanS
VAGGWVRITLTSDADSTHLTIANSCAPLAADQLPTLTEPFRRGAGDRVGPRAGAGAGLGLAIAGSVARAHQWHLDLSTPQEGVFQAVVVLPPGAGISPRAPHAAEARSGSRA